MKLKKLQDKLSKANEKIISLLKDKANMAREIIDFKGNNTQKYKPEYYPENRGILGRVDYSDDILVNEIKKNIGKGLNYYPV